MAIDHAQDLVLFTANKQVYSMDLAADAIQLLDSFPESISDLRLFNANNTNAVSSSICLPNSHQVLTRRNRAIGQPENILPVESGSVSRVPGTARGSLLFPLSTAFGPQQRQLFVLDAANDRIQVFSSGNQHRSQWGQSGSGPGEFNFTKDVFFQAESFAGSITLDSQSTIYVADVLNRRIQKFTAGP